MPIKRPNNKIVGPEIENKKKWVFGNRICNIRLGQKNLLSLIFVPEQHTIAYQRRQEISRWDFKWRKAK